MTNNNDQEQSFPSQLLNRFGFTSFLPGQLEVIEAISQKKDALAIFPTGAGKSLCYQFPSAVFLKGLTVVISPLIALMQDQCYSLEKMKIPSALLHSEMAVSEQHSVLKNIEKIKILFISPERLKERALTERLKQCNPSLFVVDEAHCITLWGHSFRPEYLKLKLLKELFSLTPILALTATATLPIEKEIIRELSLQNPLIVRRPTGLNHLKLVVEKRENQLSQILLEAKGAGLVFTSTREEAEILYKELQRMGKPSFLYHAGLNFEQRKLQQTKFLQADEGIMVATSAFGMGVNKPDIRFVVHTKMAKSFEDYFQQIGRAGRDGGPATSYLFYHRHDYQREKRLLIRNQDELMLKYSLQRLESFYLFCKEQKGCRHQKLLNYFGETSSNAKCEACNNCIKKSFWRRLFHSCRM